MSTNLPPDLPEMPPRKRKKTEDMTREEMDEAGRRHNRFKARRPVTKPVLDIPKPTKVTGAYAETSTHRQHAEATANKLPDVDFSALLASDDTPKAQAAQHAIIVMQAIIRRRAESLKLYSSLPMQEDFHASKARVRLVKGSNRSGKTLSACIEVARAVTNADPHGKYPKKGTWFLVGDDWSHHGKTIYPKLFVRGAFHVIRDLQTGELRAYRPWDPSDVARVKERKEAEPMIPKRLIQSISWHKKNEGIPKLITLKTGWTMHFFSGTSDPPQGAAIDGVLLDEEIPNEKWFPEMNSRIVDRDGKLIWSATPEVGTDAFFELCSVAEEQELLPKNFRKIEMFQLTLKDNPHISQQAKEAMSSMLSDEMRMVKVDGQFALSGRKVYQEFSKLVHGIERFDVPAEWTNFLAVDPGVQICAVLFGSCPCPADLGKDAYEFVLWDELYIPRCDAKKFAAALYRKVEGRNFESFIIDTHGSRVTEAGSGLTIYEQYSNALKEKGIRSIKTGHSFAWGNDMLKDGISMVKSYMRQQDFGKGPKLRVMYKRNANGFLEPCLPNLAKEFERYRYKQVQGITLDDTDERRDNHLMACLRYLIMSKPRYRKPDGVGIMDPAVAAFFREQERGRGNRHVHFGPGSGSDVSSNTNRRP